jgi:hypothetical protein
MSERRERRWRRRFQQWLERQWDKQHVWARAAHVLRHIKPLALRHAELLRNEAWLADWWRSRAHELESWVDGQARQAHWQGTPYIKALLQPYRARRRAHRALRRAKVPHSQDRWRAALQCAEAEICQQEVDPFEQYSCLEPLELQTFVTFYNHVTDALIAPIAPVPEKRWSVL